MASADTVQFNAPHAPLPNALDAFAAVLPAISAAIRKSRADWDKHEPRMWARARAVSDAALTEYDLARDLVQVRSGPTTYGTIILGKLRIPAINDNEGDGFVHIRIHDPPNRGSEDIVFHSLFTDEGNRDADGRPTTYRAVQTLDTPLEFFNE